jgi:hypothetical protein
VLRLMLAEVGASKVAKTNPRGSVGDKSLLHSLSRFCLVGRLTGSNRRKTQEPLESSTIFEPVVTVAWLVFSVPLYLLTWLRLYRIDLPSSVGQPFSAAYFSGHCFRLIPASGSFAASAFPVPPLHHWVPSHKAASCFGSRSLRFWCPRKMGQKKETFFMSYLYVKWNSWGVVSSAAV